MNHTTNYNLNQWEAGDRVTRDDFNADNAKIDAAIKAVSSGSPKIASGSYRGNGKDGYENQNSIEIGFAAKLVFIWPNTGDMHGIFVRPSPSSRIDGSNYSASITWSSTGVRWYGYGAQIQLNASDTTYYWVAIG